MQKCYLRKEERILFGFLELQIVAKCAHMLACMPVGNVILLKEISN